MSCFRFELYADLHETFRLGHANNVQNLARSIVAEYGRFLIQEESRDYLCKRYTKILCLETTYNIGNI